MKKIIVFSLILALMFAGGFSSTVGSPESYQKKEIKPAATALDSDLYIIDDSDSDAFYADKELKEMRIGANSTGVLVSVTGDITGGGTHLFVDTDPGAATGFTDPANGGWFRSFTFNGSGFGAEYWAAGWEQNHGDLWNSTPSVVDDNGGAAGDLPGYTFTYDAGTQTKMYYFAWSLLFPTTVPSFAELGFAAVVVGGDGTNALDVIPSQSGVPAQTDSELVTLNQYLWVNVTDTSTGALAGTPEVGYLNMDSSNLGAGNLTAGNDFVGVFNVWINEAGASTNTVNDHANTSTIVKVDISVERSGVNTTFTEFAYKEFGGRVGLGSDKHVLVADATNFQAGDKVYYTATALREASDIFYDTAASGVFFVEPLPALQVGFVGGVQPTGGFVAPGTDLKVTAQANFHKASDDSVDFNADPAANLPVNVTISWQANNSGVWTNALMTWVSFANDNNNYEFSVGSFAAGNVTFYVTGYVFASNNANVTENMLKSEQFTILIGVEPARVSVYSITDATADLSLLLPAGPSSPWDAPGLIDIVKFEVLANEFNVEFQLTFTNLTNGFGSGAGFSVVIFSIYLDIATGGQTGTMWNERVTTQTGWEWALKADGFVPEIFDAADTSAPMGGSGIIQSGDTTTNVASIVIPTSVVGTPAADWKYYVMAGSDDFNKFRQAGADHGGDWQLGGGIAGEVDPNVIDMLVPSGADVTLQDFLLGNYDAASNTLAEVLPVGQNEVFVADTVNPTGTITVTQAGSAVADGDTLSTAGTSVDVDVTISVTDSDTSVLSGLDKVEVFDGNVLVQEFSGLEGLTDELTLTVTLDVGVHQLKVNVFDVSGNFAQVTFSVTVTSTATTSSTPTSTTTTPTSTTTTDTGDGDNGGLPINMTPIVLAILSMSLVAIYRRRR